MKEKCDCSVSYVQVVGRLLSPAFNVEILEPSGTFLLKRDQLAKCPTLMAYEKDSIAIYDNFMGRGLQDFPHIVTVWRGQVGGVVVEDDWDEEEYEVDDFEEEFAL